MLMAAVNAAAESRMGFISGRLGWVFLDRFANEKGNSYAIHGSLLTRHKCCFGVELWLGSFP
jgi:hypothetical protein